MSVQFGPGGMGTVADVPLTIIGGVYPVVAASALPTPSSDNASQLYQITDFGYPYVIVQSTGAVGGTWVQVSHFRTTWANLPSASTFAGYIGYITDYFGGFRVIARGGLWRPFNPILIIKYLNADTPNSFGPDNPAVEYTLTGNTAIPDGLFQVGDTLSSDVFMARSGTLVNNGAFVRVRFGTASTVTDNSVLAQCAINGATATNVRAVVKNVLTSATQSKQYPHSSAGVSSGTVGITVLDITDIATPSLKVALTIKAAGVAEVSKPYSVEVYFQPTS